MSKIQGGSPKLNIPEALQNTSTSTVQLEEVPSPLFTEEQVERDQFSTQSHNTLTPPAFEFTPYTQGSQRTSSMGAMGAFALGQLLEPQGAASPTLLQLKPTFRDPPSGPTRDIPPPQSSIAGVGVQSANARTFAVNHGDFPEAINTTTEIHFGKLSGEQFEALSEHFGGHSQVTYSPNREYQLVDFLPPTIQALVNKDLQLPEKETIPNSASWGEEEIPPLLPGGQDKSVSLNMNCHGTAWGAAMAYQMPEGQDHSNSQIPVFLACPVSMANTTYVHEGDDDGKFEKITTYQGNDFSQFELDKLKPGDMIQFFQENPRTGEESLLHTATYVGGGMFFEKPNTESATEEFPFRLAPLGDITSVYRRDFDDDLRTSVIRPQKPMKKPGEAFSSSVQGQAQALAQQEGKSLGVELISEWDTGMSGNILGEYIGAVKYVDIQLDPETGRGSL